MRKQDSRAVVPGTPRTISYWTWLLAYAAVSAALLAPLYVYRTSVLQRGGYIESLPALILGVAFVLSIGVAIALWRSGRRSMPWLLMGLVCLVLVGEESSWGREAVMGRVLFPGDDKWDFHNWLPHQIGSLLELVDWTSWSQIAVVLTTGILAASALLPAALKAIRIATIGLPQGFLLIAVGWALFAMTVEHGPQFVAHFLDLPGFYNRVEIYKWTIEESSEIVAVTALAFAPLVRGCRHWRGG